MSYSKYPKIYPKGHSDFTQVGIPLINAYDVIVRYAINSPYKLSFNMPGNNDRWELIKKGAIVEADGQLFIIKIIYDGSENGKPYGSIEATHVWWELCEKKHIPSAFFIGQSPQSILQSVFSGVAYKSNIIRLIPNSELNGLGLTPMTDNTDIEIDKTNPIAVLLKVIENVGGEIYIDNFSFGLVRELGKDNRGLIFATDRNLKGFERTQETMQLVTRLYPYGREGLEISSINGGRSYIDSPFINDYEYVYEGHIEYRDIETPYGLLDKARFEFSSNNPHRIDKPKITYRCNAVDLWKNSSFSNENFTRFSLGDYVTVHDESLEVKDSIRIVQYDYFPYEPQNSVITLGDPPKTFRHLLEDLSGFDIFYTSEPIDVGLVQQVIDSTKFFNTITEVTRHEILAAENIHATSAFIDDMFVERLTTNIVNFRCIPNLVLTAGGGCEWADGVQTYNCLPSGQFGDIRSYIEAESIFMKFIEARLVPAPDLLKLTMAQVEPLIVNGRQLYYTSIIGGQAPYEYFTFASPESKIAGITPENAEMFKVYIRKTESSTVKMLFNFKPVSINGIITSEVEVILGAGDENGNGRMILYKSGEGAEMLYTSRITGNVLGNRVTDEGSFYKDVKSGEWVPMGSGSHVIMGHLPNQEETDELIEEMSDDSVLIIYDSTAPYVP